MKELLRLLQVKQLRTSVYHPQTDGLVERFNKTLKQMLKKAMDLDGKNWDQLLPHVQFAVREVPPGVYRVLAVRAPVWTTTPRYPGHSHGGLGKPAVPPPHHPSGWCPPWWAPPSGLGTSK